MSMEAQKSGSKRRSRRGAAPVQVQIQATPHNGEGRPDLQFRDPVNHDLIGGQVAANRMAMRYRHTVYPWARRQGKTRSRQFYFVNRATITPGEYYAGIVFPDHTTAFKIATVFLKSWGPMVKDYKINDKDQNRYIDLGPFVVPDQPAPTWFTPYMSRLWERCKAGEKNTLCRVYFWGGSYPHYEKIQGFPHPFHDIHYDETQQIHPGCYGITRPMVRDVMGHEMWTGTPWSTAIGNSQFEKFWNITRDPTSVHWFGMSIPDGCNPHVHPENVDEALRSATLDEIRQNMYAQFLSGSGAVFTNIDKVCVLPPMKQSHPSLDWFREARAKFNMPSVKWWIHQPRTIHNHVYAMTVDWARSPTGDYSVAMVFDLSTSKQVALLRWRGEDFTAQMEMVLALQQHYGASQLHSDANGMGMTMSDFMRRRHAVGFVGHKFGRNKADYVRRSQLLFADLDVQLINCAEQRQEFKDFAVFETGGIGSEKNFKYSAPEGGHDDIVAAFMQIAPTITVMGQQREIDDDDTPLPVFNKEGLTTLEALYGPDVEDLWGDPAAPISWDDVIVP